MPGPSEGSAFRGGLEPVRADVGERMTKADIVQAVYSRLGGFSKKESADLVDLVFETMKETLGRGEKIKISGFGNFVLRDKRPRQGRNPQTGTPIMITERRVLSFKASQLLKQALNSDDDSQQATASSAPPASAIADPSSVGGSSGAAGSGSAGSGSAGSGAAGSGAAGSGSAGSPGGSAVTTANPIANPLGNALDPSGRPGGSSDS